jgi:aminoglycoside 3-N-acetyltransferase
MTIRNVIKETDSPSTRDSLEHDFRAVGISEGMTLAVHSSLSSMGYVTGGPVAVILALEDVVGESGTLAMPTHTGDLTDPANWENPPVPESWHDQIRENVPAFQKDLSPSWGVGAIPECFRKQRQVLRSDHPIVSWAAWGPRASIVTGTHQLAMSQGESSPLARLYDLDAYVLLLGVGYNVNTCCHLAEYRCKFAPLKKCRHAGPVLENGTARWTSYEDIYWYEKDFETIGASFEEGVGNVSLGNVGRAGAKLFSFRRMVDHAVA